MPATQGFRIGVTQRTIKLYTAFRWEITLMRSWFGLLFFVVLLAGCGPELSKTDLGTVVYNIPKVAGVDEPYQMPQLGPPATDSDEDAGRPPAPRR